MKKSIKTGSLYKKDDLPYSIYKEKVEMLTKNLQYALNWSFQCQKIKKNERENLNITKELQKGITNYNRIFFKTDCTLIFQNKTMCKCNSVVDSIGFEQSSGV